MNRTASCIACFSLFIVTVCLAIGMIACESPVFAQAEGVTPAAASPGTQIDPAAMTLLEQSQDTMFALKTFRAECWQAVIYTAAEDGEFRPDRYTMSTLVAVKPNLMRYDNWDMTAPNASATLAAWKRTKSVPAMTFVSNGKTVWRQRGRAYRKNSPAIPSDLSTFAEPWDGFYSKKHSPYGSVKHTQQLDELLDVHLEGTEAVDGVVCDVVHYRSKPKHEVWECDSRLYIGRDGIVRRKKETIRFEDKPGYTHDYVIRNIVINAPVVNPKTIFAYTPPKGVRSEAQIRGPLAQPLLANGIAAPNFTAIDTNGKAVKLSDLRGKVVVVDFWASWCAPCVASMPHNQKVMKKLQDEGLPIVLLAVDDSDARPLFAAWVAKYPEFDALRFVHADPRTVNIAAKLYKVSGIPTQYIVDADGVIRSSSVGFRGETDAMEKAIRAAIAPRKK